MKSHSLRFSCFLIILIVFTGASLWGQALFTYNDFSAPANLQINGNANVGPKVNNVLRLTDQGTGESGSAWAYSSGDVPTPFSLVNGFTTSFQFRITPPPVPQLPALPVPPADGFAFVIQNGSFPSQGGVCPAAPNGSSGVFALEAPDINCGGDIGYTGLSHSLAIEFDDYQNLWDADANHIAVQSCGANANSADHTSACLVARTLPPIEGGPDAGLPSLLADGNVHTVVIKYSNPGCDGEFCVNPNNLQIFLDGGSTPVLTATYDLLSLALDNSGLDSAFVGFVARTGAAYSTQDILTWSLSTTQPPTQISQNTPTTITATFNGNAGNLVQEVITITPGDGTVVQAGTQMQVSNQAILPSTWQSSWVDGTPFATSSCWPHTGEGSNCKLYIDLCTTAASQIPAGANCPTSNPPSIVVQDNFDGPKVDPATLPPGTGFALLEGPDNWQGGPCTFPLNSPAAGEPCPLNLLTSVSGDPTLTATKVPHFNSTFIAASGVAQPGTLVALTPPPNLNGWISNNSVANPSVSATLTTSTQAPPVPNPFNYVQPNVAQLTYSLTNAANPGAPLASGTLTPPGPPAPPVTTFAPPPVNFGPLADGRYLLDYQGQDDHLTRELVFTLANNVYSTSDKILQVNVDTTKPTENVSLASASPYLNSNETTTYSCGDALSGVVTCGAQGYNPPVASTPAIALPSSTSTPGPHSVSITATDAAGNTSTTTVNYNVIYQFFGFIPEILFPQINKVKAGIVIPAGFLVLDGNNKPVTKLSGFSVSGFASANCGGTNPTPVVVSGSLLNFGYGIYVYNWKTSSTYAGKCVTFQANLGDGVIHPLNFQFTSGSNH